MPAAAMFARITGRSKASKEAVSRTAAAPAATAGDLPRPGAKRRRRCLKLSASERESIPSLLEPYRYRARSSSEWESIDHELQLTIQVRDHMETKGHTLYQVQCTLSSVRDVTVPSFTWACQRRLDHIRKGLHDVAKEHMGSFYAGCFKGAPFAHRGGIAGTTKRLDVWCARFARCVNSGAAPPFVVAQALKLLHAPQYLPGLDDVGTWSGSVLGSGDRLTKDAGLTDADTTDAEATGGEDADEDDDVYESDWESDSEASDDLGSAADESPEPGSMEDSDGAETADVDDLTDGDDLWRAALLDGIAMEDSLDQFMRLAAQGLR